MAAYKAAGEPIEPVDFEVKGVADKDNAALELRVAGRVLDRESPVWQAYDQLDSVALPLSEQRVLHELLQRYATADGIDYHALRTRRAGAHRFVSVHVLVPPEWSVQQGHDLLERIEADIRRALPPITVDTHLEPQGDPAAMRDETLHRDD